MLATAGLKSFTQDVKTSAGQQNIIQLFIDKFHALAPMTHKMFAAYMDPPWMSKTKYWWEGEDACVYAASKWRFIFSEP